MSFTFANNINTTLAAAASNTATTLSLVTTAGIPTSLPSGTYFALTLNDAATRSVFEVVYVTAVSGSNVTVVRGQENTAANSWLAGDYAYGAVTAGELAAFANVAGNSSQPFAVAAPNTATQAVPLGYAQGNFAARAGNADQAFAASQFQGPLFANTVNNSGIYLNPGYTSSVNSTNSANLPHVCSDPQNSNQAVTLGYAQGNFAAINNVVNTFNGRNGVVTLAAADVESALGQTGLQSGFGATALADGNNNTVTATVSFTAPGSGVILAFGVRNNSSSSGVANIGGLYVNGAPAGSENSSSSMTVFAVESVTTGTVTVSFTAALSIAFTARVGFVWLGNMFYA